MLLDQYRGQPNWLKCWIAIRGMVVQRICKWFTGYQPTGAGMFGYVSYPNRIQKVNMESFYERFKAQIHDSSYSVHMFSSAFLLFSSQRMGPGDRGRSNTCWWSWRDRRRPLSFCLEAQDCFGNWKPDTRRGTSLRKFPGVSYGFLQNALKPLSDDIIWCCMPD